MNITKLTEQYIGEHPSIKDSIKLINYSKLARRIAADLGVSLNKNFDAILIACRRYAQKIGYYETQESKILKILKQSKVEIKNKIIVVVVEKNIYFDNLLILEKEIKKKAELFHIIEGANVITIITTEEFLDRIGALFKNKIIKENRDLVEITLKSPKEIETTAGVVNYLYSLFWENGINIVETMSCWTDTLFVIKEDDIGKIMQLLKF